MKAVNSIGLMAVLACAALAAQAAELPLRLCADPDNMPFSSKPPAASGKAADGLYVEIGQAVADALGRPMETVWSLSYFGKRNIRTTMLERKCDFMVGLPAMKDFMGPRVVFSRPILKLGYALVVPKSHPAKDIDDLKGRRVAVQFASPPQSLLAMRDDITSVTTMDPEEAMRRLAAGEVDAAFVWGPSAGYINHTALHDAFRVTPVTAPQMQFDAAIGFAREQGALRDQVDAVVGRLEPRIRALSAKYAVSVADEPLQLAAAGPVQVLTQPARDTAVAQAGAVAATAPAAPATQAAAPGDVKLGKEVFNGTCAHCHGPDAIVADRKINLRRLQEKYGDQAEDVFFTTVTQGRPTKGMPAWKDVFKHEDFVNILAYLKTVQEK